MQRLLIGFGVNSHTADSQLPAGADHSDGDFSTVGDEDFMKHAVGFANHYIRNIPNLLSALGAFTTTVSASPNTWRVSAGSRTPSSQSRAVE